MSHLVQGSNIHSLVLTALSSAVVGLAVYSAGHALLHKRDPRSQLLWAMGSLLVPLLGAMFYWFFGVNRILTRARKWQSRGLFGHGLATSQSVDATLLNREHPEMANNMQLLLQISERVTHLPLVGHNHITLLRNGDTAYPAMLSAIEAAKEYIYLCSYIFEGDNTGQEFARVLVAAGKRGVDVRILVDAIGGKLGSPIRKFLVGKPGVRFESFLPPSLNMRILRINLRNHRKILVVDGTCGFTGGMNISDRHVVRSPKTKTPTKDLHFQLAGPIVQSLEEVFSEDWCFRVGKTEWPAPNVAPSIGTALCRGVKDGPNEDFEKLQWILIGALSCAQKSVRILTPYFIPSRELLTAMHTAVLRGAKIELILPKKSNLPYVDWATLAYLAEVIALGINVYYQPAPFDHSKLLVVDEFYVNLGSANLDPRSLRLNFEFNVEVYDKTLAQEVAEHHEQIKQGCTLVTALELASQSLPRRLRNATAKVFSGYL